MNDFQVRPMKESEFAAFRAELVRDYAAEKAEAGEYEPAEAEDRAAADVAALLPGGVATDGHVLLVGEAGGEVAGRVWVGLRHPTSPIGTAWIYSIDVRPQHRGKGYSRVLLAAAEAATAEHGVPYLGLNVFGPNLTARRLYETSGYEINSIQMRKKV